MAAEAPHPFAPLLAPLAFAARKGFAQLGKVRDLRTPLAGALLAASAAGVKRSVIARLERELPKIDQPSLEERQASVHRVVKLLDESGLRLPPELASLARTPPQGVGSTSQEPRPKRKPPDLSRSLSISPRSGPLAQPLTALGKRLGPRMVAALKRRGLASIGDVVFTLPRGYEDRRRLRTIAELRPGERGVFLATVRSAIAGGGRFGRSPFRVVLADDTGSVTATYFQGGAWLKGRFPVGKRLLVSGEIRVHASGWEVAHPDIEPVDDGTLPTPTASAHFGRVVPIYPGFERHEQRAFRELAVRAVEQHLGALEEPLPGALRERMGLPTLAQAIHSLHFPEAPRDEDELEALRSFESPAHRRLAFDELFFLQLGLGLRRKSQRAGRGIAFDVSPERLAMAWKMLPFAPTSAQERVVGEIAGDMARPEPMSRLVQGDVGSGKTAVAAVAAALALFDGKQVAVMAPTEILAEQHFANFRRWVEPLGFKAALLKGGGGSARRRADREAVASGAAQLIVGTHALIQEGVEFRDLGLTIVDEQHRFGVMQRQALSGKGLTPDTLVMTATPIPRTLSMTLYGDLDVSVIDALPPGRSPILTRAFPEKSREQVYRSLERTLAEGHQIYVIYPLVEESEKVDLADATRGAEALAERFPQAKVGLLHGRMSAADKEAVMERFRSGDVRLLVSTTVVEVGVDVPNATAMVIEQAERFGLSQLHQLRGRVGRGSAASSCYLIAGSTRSKEAMARLEVMVRSQDGFKIAEKDLELRGPGELLGTRQSGLPELVVADLSRDGPLLDMARCEAQATVEADPRLERPEHRPMARALEERWSGRLALARVG